MKLKPLQLEWRDQENISVLAHSLAIASVWKRSFVQNQWQTQWMSNVVAGPFDSLDSAKLAVEQTLGIEREAE